MKGGIYVAVVMLLASLAAMAPNASANHECIPVPEQTPCLLFYSPEQGDGDCDGETPGGVQNHVGFNLGLVPGVGAVRGSVSTYCWQGDEKHNNEVNVRATAGPLDAKVHWRDYDDGYYSNCYDRVTLPVVGKHEVGLCDVAGPPPMVPGLAP